jgi:hypothetical protein
MERSLTEQGSSILAMRAEGPEKVMSTQMAFKMRHEPTLMHYPEHGSDVEQS